MTTHNMSLTYIEAYLLELLKNVEKYHPLLIYLIQKNGKKLLQE